MKIYLIQPKFNNGVKNGRPILTASYEKAIWTEKYFATNGMTTETFTYNVKTQGKNFNKLAFAERFKREAK